MSKGNKTGSAETVKPRPWKNVHEVIKVKKTIMAFQEYHIPNVWVSLLSNVGTQLVRKNGKLRIIR